MPKIIAVVPTIRPESHAAFVEAWRPLFEKHSVTLITVWDGEEPRITEQWPEGTRTGDDDDTSPLKFSLPKDSKDLFCRFTDACRNLGFVYAATLNPDFVLTMDDDVKPVTYDTHRERLSDPIQAHLDALAKRVPLSWMNTAHDTKLYLRGVPYGVRDEAPVMLSHGVWVGVPDFDGETQLRLEGYEIGNAGKPVVAEKPIRGIPHSLPYYVGPIPRGVLAPICGMNLMVRKEALPYLYFAPMGRDAGVDGECGKCKGCVHKGYVEETRSDGHYRHIICPVCKGTTKVPLLHRFADIWMGVFLKRKFDELGWACYTGASTVLHERASDAGKNFEQEKLGREWNEWLWDDDMEYVGGNDSHLSDSARQYYAYAKSYADKRTRYAELVRGILDGAKS